MALTKTQLEALVSTNLADNTNIPAIQHREVENELINSIYGSSITQSGTGATFSYELKFYKKQDIVYVTGYITNVTLTTLQSGALALLITNPLYYSTDNTIIPCATLQNANALIRIYQNSVYLNSILAPLSTLQINSHYKITE